MNTSGKTMTWLIRTGKDGWQVRDCKHCGLAICSQVGKPYTWIHAEGEQRGKNRCAIDPYGFDAAPADELCSFACNGYRDVPGTPVLFREDEYWAGTVKGEWAGHPGWLFVNWAKPEQFTGLHRSEDLLAVIA